MIWRTVEWDGELGTVATVARQNLANTVNETAFVARTEHLLNSIVIGMFCFENTVDVWFWKTQLCLIFFLGHNRDCYIQQYCSA